MEEHTPLNHIMQDDAISHNLLLVKYIEACENSSLVLQPSRNKIIVDKYSNMSDNLKICNNTIKKIYQFFNLNFL